MAKFQLGGTLESKLKILKIPRNGSLSIGRYSGIKTENTQSDKKWINFNFFRGG